MEKDTGQRGSSSVLSSGSIARYDCSSWHLGWKRVSGQGVRSSWKTGPVEGPLDVVVKRW